ncbi:hypothetical protein [Actinoallomurus sp. NPDC052274]|uniref:hypothetical protein n=1 Tax=Actinoallomurus sp. NPDC052274 TaxID=3155420 RepID=UPI00342C9FD6
MTEPPRGTPIDESAMPAWAKPYFSEDQRKRLDASLLWILLITNSTSLEPSRLHLAHRLHVYMLTLPRGARMEWAPSVVSLAASTNLSEKTIETAIKDLAEQGWLRVTKRRRRTSIYRLAWPVKDCLLSDDEPTPCGALTTKGAFCTRPAGWGTGTPGEGPCKYHRPDDEEAGAPDTDDPQSLRPNDPADEPGSSATNAGQSPVDNTTSPATDAGQSPVDNAGDGRVDPQRTQQFTRNECGDDPQQMRGSMTTGVPPERVTDTSPPSHADLEGTARVRFQPVDEHPRDGPELFRRASQRLVFLDADFRDRLIAQARADLGPAAGREQVLIRAAALADQPETVTEPSP